VEVLATAFAPEAFFEQLEVEHRIKREVREVRPVGFVQ
jgi:hypothetical protein